MLNADKGRPSVDPTVAFGMITMMNSQALPTAMVQSL